MNSNRAPTASPTLIKSHSSPTAPATTCYAIDASKIKRDRWTPKQDHTSGFRKTVKWYLDNTEWTENILSGEYVEVGQRLALIVEVFEFIKDNVNPDPDASFEKLRLAASADIKYRDLQTTV